MCVIAMAYRALPGYRLVVLANRDEFHRRPTAAAHWWPPDEQLLAGRDLEAGGTWLGVTRGGRLAAVTNVREPGAGSGDRSRGELPLEFLRDDAGAEMAARRAREGGGDYGGFNLVMWDGEGLAWCSNRSDRERLLEPGIYALSNHRLDTPWPKAERIRSALAHGSGLPGWLAALRDDRPAADEDLPDTGVGLERERLLSPVFIRGPTYGTRCSTVVTVGDDGEARFLEIGYGPGGEETGRVRESWNVDSA